MRISRFRSAAIRYARMLEEHLVAQDGRVVGDGLTGADFMLSFPLVLAHFHGWFETLPAIHAYVAGILARPAFQSAIAGTLAYFQRIQTATPPMPSYRENEPL